MTARFEIYQDKSEREETWRWRLVEKFNGDRIARGGEAFSSESEVRRSIENVCKEIADNPEIVEV